MLLLLLRGTSPQSRTLRPVLLVKNELPSYDLSNDKEEAPFRAVETATARHFKSRTRSVQRHRSLIISQNKQASLARYFFYPKDVQITINFFIPNDPESFQSNIDRSIPISKTFEITITFEPFLRNPTECDRGILSIINLPELPADMTSS